MYRKGGSIYKEYDTEQMLSPKRVVAERVSQINSFDYSRFKALAETKISIRNDILVYKQEFLIENRPSLDALGLYELADALEYLECLGFVHGDINRKNIVHTTRGYKVIDFEPDLYQRKNKIKQWMVTIPYIAKSDIERKRVTTLTDKIGFAYFILRLTGRFKSKDIVALSRSFNHEYYLGADEAQLRKLSYKDLLKRYFGTT